MANVLFIVYDNGSHIPFFPLNVFYLVDALKKQPGNRVGIWHQDIHHGKAAALTEIIDNNPFDIVCLGFVAGYYQYSIAKELADAVNRSKRRSEINFVLGGHGPGAEPGFFLGKLLADTVVVGDGERAIAEIASSNRKGVVKGSPCDNDMPDLDTYRDFPLDIYRLIRWPTSTPTDYCFPILSSRGCKWSCSFCYRMREGYHMRSVDAIIGEIKFLHKNFHINHFQFADELLMASEKRTAEICEALLKLPFRIKWDCNGRLNFAKPAILKLMRKSGAEYINYGIESLNQDMLNQMGKGLTVDRIFAGVESTLKEGLSPGLNLIWGFPGDTVANLTKAVQFLQKYDPCHELRTIRPVTPYPGTKLYRQAIEQGLLEGPEDFYENKHVNSDLFSVNFMDIPTKDAHEALHTANNILYSSYLVKKNKQMQAATHRLYIQGKTDFRGFRAI